MGPESPVKTKILPTSARLRTYAPTVVLTSIKQAVERHPYWIAVSILLIIGGPFLNLWLPRWEGVAVAEALGIIAGVTAYKAFMKVKTIDRQIS